MIKFFNFKFTGSLYFFPFKKESLLKIKKRSIFNIKGFGARFYEKCMGQGEPTCERKELEWSKIRIILSFSIRFGPITK